MSPLVVDGDSLTPEAVRSVARNDQPVRVADAARKRVQRSRDHIESIVESDATAYGVNTGFGGLATTRIPEEDLTDLQLNLLRSHAAGVGEPLPTPVVRAMLLTRLNALAIGHSGVRERVLDHLQTLLNEGVHPVVYSRGSLGASGDLAPLAHLSLVLVGEGEATVDGERMAGAAALEKAGLDPLSLAPKEGLALINGTQLTTGLAALLVVDAERLLRAADMAGALTTEVTMSTTTHCDPAVHDLRAHDGQVRSAANIRRLTHDSEVLASHRDCDRVQDAYSIRCLPQVHGAVRDAAGYLRDAVETELNSATDNPLVFEADAVDDRAPGTEEAAVLPAGNFHGEQLALRIDHLTAALSELAAISERRTDRLLNPNLQEPHLPAFLAQHPGKESGLMIAQYTAASLVNEIRSLGRPSMDNTPTSGNQEDHVSMSAQSAFHARTAVHNAQTVVAIELLCATEGAEYVDDDLAFGTGTAAIRRSVRDRAPSLDGDRELHADIESLTASVASGSLDDAVASVLEDPLS